jgi:hypothetical protein
MIYQRRSFHESISSSPTRNIEPVTNWTDLPRFERSPDILTAVTSDSIEIENMTNYVLADVLKQAQTVPPQLYLLALSIKTEQKPGEQPHLYFINLRTPNKIYAFKVR